MRCRVIVEMYLRMPNSMSPVRNRLVTRPFTRTVVSIASSSPSPIPVTIYGPIGLNVSVFFERQNVRSDFCQARSLTSLPIVKPSTQDSASDSDRCLARLPITTASSPSYCTFVAPRGITTGSSCATIALTAR